MVNIGMMYPPQVFPQFGATHICQYATPQVPTQITPHAPQFLTSQAYPQGQFSNQNLPDANPNKPTDY